MATKTFTEGYTTPTDRTTGIDGTTGKGDAVTAAAGVLGSEIDNATNGDTLMDVELAWTPTTAPTEDDVVNLYMLRKVSGGYEIGSATEQPKIVPLLIGATLDGTSTYYAAATGIPIPPEPFKLLAWNAMDKTAAIVVKCKTYRRTMTSS